MINLKLSLNQHRKIYPCHNKALHQIVRKLANRANVPIPKLYYYKDMLMNAQTMIDGSAIVVPTKLIDKVNTHLVTEILAHEIGHVAIDMKKDAKTKRFDKRIILNTILMSLLKWCIIPLLFIMLVISFYSWQIGLIYLGLIVAIYVGVLLKIYVFSKFYSLDKKSAINKLSQRSSKNELKADTISVKLTHRSVELYYFFAKFQPLLQQGAFKEGLGYPSMTKRLQHLLNVQHKVNLRQKSHIVSESD